MAKRTNNSDYWDYDTKLVPSEPQVFEHDGSYKPLIGFDRHEQAPTDIQVVGVYRPGGGRYAKS